jgi:hypothetical protein
MEDCKNALYRCEIAAGISNGFARRFASKLSELNGGSQGRGSSKVAGGAGRAGRGDHITTDLYSFI